MHPSLGCSKGVVIIFKRWFPFNAESFRFKSERKQHNILLFCDLFIQTNCCKVNIENRAKLPFKDDQATICELCEESYVGSRSDHLYEEHFDEMKFVCLYLGVGSKYRSKKKKCSQKTSPKQPRRIVPTRVSDESEMRKASSDSSARNLHASCKTQFESDHSKVSTLILFSLRKYFQVW